MHHRLSRSAMIGLAILSLTIACSKSPEKLKSEHLSSGEAYFRAQKYKEAVIEYRAVLQIDINDKTATRQLGLSYYALGEVGPAYPLLSRARETSPDDVEVTVKLARIYLLRGKPDDARKEVDDILAKDSTRVEALLLLVDLVKSPEEAADLIQRLQDSKNTSNADLLQINLALGRLYARGNDFAQAERALHDAVASSPNSPAGHLALGDFYSFRKDLRKAEEEYQTAVGLAPEVPDAGIKLADCQLFQKRNDEAKATLLTVIEKNPTFLPALYRLGEIFLTERNLGETGKLIETMLKQNPADPEGLLLRGRVLLARGETDPAIADFTQVAKAQPTLAQPRFFLSIAYLQSGDVEKARGQLREALAISPDFTEAIMRMAELDLEAGRLQDAFAAAQRVVLKNPSHLGALIIMAEAADNPSAINEALKYLDRAREGTT